jgi:hypothetical protein
MVSLNVTATLDKLFTHEGAAAAAHDSARERLLRTVASTLLWEPQYYESGDRIAAQAVLQVMARWQLDLEGLLPHQAIALQARIADYLADVASAVGYTGAHAPEDLRFVAAARQAGIDGDLLEALRRERQFKTAVREWQQYQEWLRSRNPKRAALERQFGMDTKHAMHLVRLMRTCRDLVVDGVMRVERPDHEELLEIRRGAWSFERLVEDVQRYGEEADRVIRLGGSPLPAAPDEAAINRACIELTAAYAESVPRS